MTTPHQPPDRNRPAQTLGGIIHTYQAYDPKSFPPPTSPPPDMVSGAFEHMLTFGSTREQWIEFIEAVPEFARDLMNKTVTARRKAARSTARSVLPNCTETKLMVTMNARAQRHVLSMRGAPSAEIEIRRVATLMHEALEVRAPWLFGDYEFRESDDGVGFLESPYPKV